MATTVIYNGVILRDCETKSFSQTVQMDDSNTDLLFSRFTIRVASTLVATSYPAQSFGVDTPLGSTVTQRAKDIHTRLSEPRKDFYFLVDHAVNHERTPTTVLDESLLTATGDLVSNGGEMPLHPITSQIMIDGNTISRASVVDADNGPKPKSISITEIIGGRSMRVEFEIEVCRKICIPGFSDIQPDAEVWGDTTSSIRNPLTPSVSPQTVEVLSNRWNLSESKDENWITTRTLEGTLRVIHPSYWPHLMRLLCVPTLLKGYKRIRQSFVDDATGLVLRYTIEDQQAHAAPPYPAIKWTGHHAETSTGANGSILGGEFSIRLTGPTGVDKVQLIGAAGKIAVDRIRGLVPTFTEGGERVSHSTILKNASIINLIDQPTIELKVQVQYTDKDMSRALALRIASMGEPLTTLTGADPYQVEEYDPKVWPVPLAYDSPTPAGVFACYLQHPCSVWHDMPDGLPPADVLSPETAEESANRPQNSPGGESDYHLATVTRSPHEIPLDTTYLKPFSTGMTNLENLFDYPYTFIDMQSEYRINNGWCQLPFADTSPSAERTAALVKLHGSTAKRVVTMTATRDGHVPMLPSMAETTTDPNGIKEALDDIIIVSKVPELLAGAQGRRYSVQATYIYLMERAPRPDEILRIGSSPLDRILPELNKIPLATSTDTGGVLQSPGATWE